MALDILHSRRARRLILAVALASLVAELCAASAQATIVRFTTSLGSFDVRLYDTAMPRTVANFLHYVTTNKYDGTVIHRNSDTKDTENGPWRDFVIQGGGFSLTDPVAPQTIMTSHSVPTIAPIADEPGGGVRGLSNLRGTIAMAKSGPNTVTSQWFINQGDNSFLDDPTRPDGGFAAFGRVLGNGMSIVDAIGDLQVPNDFGFGIGSPYNDLPLRDFSGTSINDIRSQHTVTVNDVSVLNVPSGDYVLDGRVTTADFNLWRSTYGSTTNASADGNGSGKVDIIDYVLWRHTLGQSVTLPSASSSVVPEPATGLLSLGAAFFLAACARRFRRPRQSAEFLGTTQE